MMIIIKKKKRRRVAKDSEGPIQQICQLHSSSRTQNSISILPVCCPYYDILTLSSRETFWINISFHPDWLRSRFIFIRLTHTLSWMVWTVWYTLDFSQWRIFLALCCGKQSDAQREKRERGSQDSLGRQCVRSGALGPFGWLTLNGCPGEVTKLIENRLRGEGNAFALRLAPWPTVQRLPWQLWNPTYLFATLWRERVEQLSE